jgi:Predicted metal-binding, possibly nucleic acid-binding protein
MWRRTTMRLELQKLNIEQGSSQSFEFEETSVGDLSGVTLLEPVTGQFVLSNLGIGYQFSGSFSATVSQPCVRCLDPVVEDVEFDVNETYLLHGEEDPDQEDVFALESDVLDVSDVVRQNLLIEVSEFPLCKEDCKGLCPECGANLNSTMCPHQKSLEEK